MIDVVNSKIYRVGEDVYFINQSIDKPHLYIKCFGTIMKKEQNGDNVIYFIKVKKFFIDIESSKMRIHRRVFKTRKIDTGQAVMKKIYCSEFFEQPEAFSRNLCELLKEHLMVIPSVYVRDELFDLESLYDKATEIIKDKLKTNLNELKNY